MRRLALTALLAALAFATTASAKQYILKHPKHEHCRTHYARKVEHIKRHHKRVREVVCTYVAPKPAKVVLPATTTPATIAPTTPAPSSTISLRAHLDPSFTQDPANPLVVTFDYSASAEQQSGGVTLADPDLPSGVLAFYSEGLLACSMNVGGSTTGGECTIDYSAFGTHAINAIYTSGEASVTTGSETVEVEPPQIIPTVTTQAASAEIEGAPDASGKCYNVSGPDGSTNRICEGTVTVNTTARNGEALLDDRSIVISQTQGGPGLTLEVPAGATGCEIKIVEGPVLEVGLSGVQIQSPCGWTSERGSGDEPGDWWVTSHYAGQSGPLSAPLGWAASQSESVLFWSE
jgi:hypothetical protein